MKSFYMTLAGPSVSQVRKTLMWCGKTLSCVEVFGWLAVAGKVSMVNNLRRKGTYGFGEYCK